MQRRIIFEATLLILVFASIWAILARLPLFQESRYFGLSIEKEEQLGDLLLKSILSRPGMAEIKSDSVETGMEQITDRLTHALDHSEYDYHIHVVHDEMANAFAIPGGHIVVTSGLFSVTETAGEMAAVIAHEMGHIEERHTLSRLLRNFTINLLFSDDMLISEASSLLVSSAFDRKQEEEADAFALTLLEKASIDPRILGSVFRHIREKSGAYNPRFEIVMSHPDMDSRIKKAYDYEVREGFTEVPLKIDWESMRGEMEKAEETDDSFV
jgi:predicted Zn-dependent protease